MKKVLLLLLLASTLIGCKESLPAELENRRINLNDRAQRILDKEERSVSYRESTRILTDYKSQKKLTLFYKKLLDDQGYSDRFNPESLIFLDEKIKEYSNNGVATNNESARHTCNICGKSFVGRGYEEKSTGLWVLTQAPYQSFICSSECGAMHTERQVKKYGF